MITQRETADEMLERCEYVFEIDGGEYVGGGDYVFGATIIGDNGRFMAVEVGVGDDGVPFAALRVFKDDGSPGLPTMLTIGDSILVTP